MLAQVVVSSIVLLVLDSIFIYFMSQTFIKQVFEVQHSPLKVNFAGAIFTYVLLIFGVNYFILLPKNSVIDAFLLGLVIYGVFEGTNYSLLKNWKPTTVMIDTLWGGTLLALTTYLTRKIS
jgi:uncharacterized membrane protein